MLVRMVSLKIRPLTCHPNSGDLGSRAQEILELSVPSRMPTQGAHQVANTPKRTGH